MLHGAPGSGKSTIARALFERLRMADKAVAVVDRDELGLVHPSQGYAFSLRNMKAIWPSYAAIDGLRALIPTVVVDVTDYHLLRDALPASRFIICELIAPKEVLKRRISVREPNAFWRSRLEEWVDIYYQRDASQKFGDFEVTTHDKSVDETAGEILARARWLDLQSRS